MESLRRASPRPSATRISPVCCKPTGCSSQRVPLWLRAPAARAAGGAFGAGRPIGHGLLPAPHIRSERHSPAPGPFDRARRPSLAGMERASGIAGEAARWPATPMAPPHVTRCATGLASRHLHARLLLARPCLWPQATGPFRGMTQHGASPPGRRPCAARRGKGRDTTTCATGRIRLRSIAPPPGSPPLAAPQTPKRAGARSTPRHDQAHVDRRIPP